MTQRLLLIATCTLGLLLAGCAEMNSQAFYNDQAYARKDWAHKSFDEARAKCRYDTLNKKQSDWNFYEVQPKKFKACMDKYGYAYGG